MCHAHFGCTACRCAFRMLLCLFQTGCQHHKSNMAHPLVLRPSYTSCHSQLPCCYSTHSAWHTRHTEHSLDLASPPCDTNLCPWLLPAEQGKTLLQAQRCALQDRNSTVSNGQRMHICAFLGNVQESICWNGHTGCTMGNARTRIDVKDSPGVTHCLPAPDLRHGLL